MRKMNANEYAGDESLDLVRRRFWIVTGGLHADLAGPTLQDEVVERSLFEIEAKWATVWQYIETRQGLPQVGKASWRPVVPRRTGQVGFFSREARCARAVALIRQQMIEVARVANNAPFVIAKLKEIDVDYALVLERVATYWPAKGGRDHGEQ